jgi:hypothetical protein
MWMAAGASFLSGRSAKIELKRCHGWRLERAQAPATVHKTRWGLTLRDLEDKGIPFCKLTAKETVEGEQVMVARFGHAWWWWGQPPAVLRLRLAPFKLLLGSIASNVNECSLCGGYLCALGFGACGTKFDKYERLFIGLLGPTRRGDGVLHFLSLNRTLIRLRLEDFWKGMNFGLVMIWKPNSRPG